MSRTTVATIHLGALRHNLALIQHTAAPARVMAVVKADAYGHGLERV
ncbi:MAG TPA: alanine racemase, partial [Dyella sp.]|nr:alanine racemase [Dyella sp.]